MFAWYLRKVKHKYGLPLQKALRATLRREILLVQRNSFVYVFRFFQVCLSLLGGCCRGACWLADHARFRLFSVSWSTFDACRSFSMLL